MQGFDTKPRLTHHLSPKISPRALVVPGRLGDGHARVERLGDPAHLGARHRGRLAHALEHVSEVVVARA